MSEKAFEIARQKAAHKIPFSRAVLKDKLKNKIAKKKQQKNNYTPPRYDDVYYQGVEWLDTL